jgi:hypothetical protein
MPESPSLRTATGLVAVAACATVGPSSEALFHWRYRVSLNPDTICYPDMAA